MREKRLSRVFRIGLMLCAGILLLVNVTASAQAQYINPNIPARSSSLYAFYPTAFIPPIGAGLGGIIPITSSSQYTLANPFVNYNTSSASYKDIFTTTGAQQFSYSNALLGINAAGGSGYYHDPFVNAGGQYLNYSTPFTGFSTEKGFINTPFGGQSSASGSFYTPWTTVGFETSSAYGLGAIGNIPVASFATSASNAVLGLPTMFSGLNPAVEGTLLLNAFGSQTASIDRALSNTYFYTKEGMPYIPVASYFNANSVGGSNYFFTGGASTVETGTTTLGGFPVSGYSMVQEINTAPYGTGGVFTGWLGTGTASSLGSAVLTGGAAPATGGAGAVFAGWGVPSGASFGVVSGGWGGGFTGGGFTGGVFGGGAGLAGSAFGIGGGGTTYGGTNVGW